MSDGGAIWLMLAALALLIMAGAVVWLVWEGRQFLLRASKTLDQVNILIAKKDNEIGDLLKSVNIVSEEVQSVIEDIAPIVKVFKKMAVTADDLSEKGAKAFLSLNSLVSRLFIGMIQGSKKDKK